MFKRFRPAGAVDLKFQSALGVAFQQFLRVVAPGAVRQLEVEADHFVSKKYCLGQKSKVRVFTGM